MHDVDPDETEGRRLYRERADALAASQQNIAKRRVKLPRRADGELPKTEGKS